MSVKDFFTAVIKIMAIYILIEGIIPIIAQIIYLGEIEDFSFIAGFLGVILVFIAVIYFMLSRANTTVKFLSLDKGFSTERFDFSKSESNNIVEIAIAIIGVYMLVFTIPYILMDGYTLLKSNINSHVFSIDEIARDLQTNLVINFLYILVGLVLLFLRKPISTIFTTETDKK